MKRWFLPEMPDLLGLLREQAAVTRDGVDRLASWSHGSPGAGDAIRGVAETSGESKRTLQTALRSAFSTPLDPEDIYELSERLDAVMNSAKDLVRESEVIAMGPDEPMGTMSDHLAAGLAHLMDAFDALGSDDAAATEASDEAVAACRSIESTYEAAMSRLLANDDLREVMSRRELYRRYARTADAVAQVAGRIWYAVVKSP